VELKTIRRLKVSLWCARGLVLPFRPLMAWHECPVKNRISRELVPDLELIFGTLYLRTPGTLGLGLVPISHFTVRVEHKLPTLKNTLCLNTKNVSLSLS